MSRPSTIWLAFVACALLLAGAMAVVSRHAIGLEHDRVLAAADADAGQRVRLALWRMDSAATAILVRENSRPPADFRNPEPPGDAPDGARLYFEINGEGKLMAPSRGEVSGTTGDYRAALRRLLNLMDAPAAPAPGTGVPMPVQADAKAQTRDASAQQVQNADIAFAAANAVNASPVEEDADKKLAAAAAPQASAPKSAPPAMPSAIGPAPETSKSKAPAQQIAQGKLDVNELSQRAKAVQKSTNRYNVPSEGQGGGYGGSQPAAKKLAEAKAEKPQIAATDAAGEAKDRDTRREARTDSASASPADAGQIQQQDNIPRQQAFRTSDGQFGVLPATADSRVTAMQPVWIDGELLLVRAVGEGARQRVQGIWIDHRVLAASLLEAIRDLLPAASLAPYEPFVFTRDNVVLPGAAAGLATNRLTAVPRALEDVPMAMVSLPWELVPGPLPPLAAATGSALRILLSSAWTGAVLAILAAAFLLRGVLVLSERRAAFVSSVTHELRTPLTTFTLYSEMLADGMVKDPEKQHRYLRTLHTEAGRLGHLVENVLAYSRIERGSARTRMESINIQTLADRLMPRLSERAASVGATIDISLPADLAGRALTTDASAVEQIVFNLVDNAAKYAPPVPAGPPWQLVFSVARAELAIDFRDHGPGIPYAERKRLFRPFHKSAQDAANSKPGVGLGLALSRRLAKALGGSLALAESGTSGTTFRLVLPMTAR